MKVGRGRVRTTRQDTEHWFLQRGLPLFITDYDARTRVWTRAAPFLAAVYVLLSLVVAWPSPGFMVLALLPLLAAWVLGNLADRRPPFSAPRRIGPAQLVVFAIGPALPHIAGGDWQAAMATVLVAVVILAITYFVVAYGVIPLVVWVLRRLTKSLPEVRNAAVRALPMLLIFIAFLLFAGETWQVFGRLSGIPFVLTQLLFAGAGVAFVATRLRADSASLEAFASWDEVHQHAAATPAAALPGEHVGTPPPIPLSARERRNVLLLLMSNRVIMALSVALVMGLFYLILGFLTIDLQVARVWLGVEPNVLVAITYRGRTMILSEEHLRVAGFLASFSGFYFGVYSVSEPAIRDGLADDGTTQLREACAARQLYRAAVDDAQVM